jgi:Zn-dependent metalloprotease
MCQQHHRNPIFCILPPHILRSIAQKGTDHQRQEALNTLATDNTLRAIRTGNTLRSMFGPKPAPNVLAAEGQKQRTIHSANNSQELPGTVVRAEGAAPTGDPAIDEAYDGLGATFDFFWDIYSRNSIDDEGMPLSGTVHFGEDYNNAFWDGKQMVFGDGDGDLFNRFTIALDIISHELTHGVTEDEAQLVYFFQAGAINESISDVFGALVKQRVLNQTADKADWLIGQGLFTDQVEGVALRSMKEPGTAFDDPVLGKDPQPGHMKDFVNTYQDNGGVHINSGIPNRAFYLVATSLGGFAWEKAGRIWYETLRDSRIRPNTGFRGFARRTIAQAKRIYGDDSVEQKAVTEGWQEVGIEIA